jgi:hypothetical protein
MADVEFTDKKLNKVLEKLGHVEIRHAKTKSVGRAGEKWEYYDVELLTVQPSLTINLTVEDTPEFSSIYEIKFDEFKIKNTREIRALSTVIKSLSEFVL